VKEILDTSYIQAAAQRSAPSTPAATTQFSAAEPVQSVISRKSWHINFDTGNAFLCGHDPYKWLRRVVKRLVHLHAKDISVQQSGEERGKVTGTPVGCACGDGVIDWAKVIGIIRKDCPRDIVLSVECGTVDQAERSIQHLKALV
jgi:sugar phosphate isomerase/epimerase